MGLYAHLSQEGMLLNKWTSRCQKDVQIKMPRTLILPLEATTALASTTSRISKWRMEVHPSL